VVIIDNTIPKAEGCITFAENVNGETGYAIHYDEADKCYSLYTDDGRGNGDFICSTGNDKQMMLRIAYLLHEDDESRMRDAQFRNGRNAFNRLS
jgi:hypothetical protein